MRTADEFLNPKSMLTPGIAGGIVMMISNTLLAQFQLPAKWTALSLSFMLALVVFLAAIIPMWQRAIYYIFNALIIFSVAVGANKVGTATQSGDRAPDLKFTGKRPTIERLERAEKILVSTSNKSPDLY